MAYEQQDDQYAGRRGAQPVKRKSKKGLAIGLIAGFFALAVIVGVIRGLSGGGQTPTPGKVPDPGPASASPVTAASPESPTAPATPDIPATPLVTVGEGEFLYTGHLELENTSDFEMSFILSADLSYIRDITLTVRDLEASQKSGSMTTTVTVSNMTQTYTGEFPVDFMHDNFDIGLGKSAIYCLAFEGNQAFLELYYVYSSTGTGGSADIEIPIGFAAGVLTTDEAPTPPSPEPSALPETPETPEEPPTPSTQTVFATGKLINWSGKLSGGVRGFRPASPEPRYYIVIADTVIDPVTGRESEGGYGHDYARHNPVDTDDVLLRSGKLTDGGLILTDDPDLATYALIVTFVYDHTGTFTFSDNSRVTQYHGTTSAELYNMVTGDSIYTGGMTTYSTYANESVFTAMLDNAKGKQFYAQSHTISASDFDDYWEFIED